MKASRKSQSFFATIVALFMLSMMGVGLYWLIRSAYRVVSSPVKRTFQK